MRVLIAVTHLLGAGHLTRAAALGRAFARSGHDTLLVSGGVPAPMVRQDGLRWVQLPPLHVVGTDFARPLGPDGRPADAALLDRRRARLLETLADFAPDAVITELFPFGRRALAAEFLALVEAAAQRRPRPLVLASVRDILVASAKPERIAQAHARVADLYDAVLVHGDPTLVALDASWPLDVATARVIRYTGYIDEGPVIPQAPIRDGVLVAAGSGPAGLGLLQAAAAAARMQPSLGWRILAGHGVPDSELAAIGLGLPDGTIMRARRDYRALLAGAALSVSQCGYNTAIDLLATATPAVLVPFEAGGETEQRLRAQCLAERALARVLPESELTAASLLEAVSAQIAAGPPKPHGIDLGGAARSVAIVKVLLAGLSRRGANRLMDQDPAQVPSPAHEGEPVADGIDRLVKLEADAIGASPASALDEANGPRQVPFPPPCAGYRIQTSLPDAKSLRSKRVSPPLAIPGLPGIARACGEGSGVGVVQKAPSRAILHHPHLQLLPARGRRARLGQRRVKIVASAGKDGLLLTQAPPCPADGGGSEPGVSALRPHTPGLRALQNSLDAAAERGQRVALWWRDDDAVAASPALDRMIDLADAHGAAILLAAIPARIEPSLAERLIAAPVWRVAIHGLAHHNHAPTGEKAAEFGAHRPLAALVADAAAGLRIARERLPASMLLPVFVPPWNRIDAAFAAALPGLGYRGLSAVPGPAIPGLTRVDATLDPIDWRGTRSLRDPEGLLADLAADIDRAPGRPIGLLTHHRVHDTAIWAFVAALLTLFRDHPGGHLVDPGTLFAAAAVDSGAATPTLPV